MMLQRIRRRGARRADNLKSPVLLQVRFQEDIASATRKGEKELRPVVNSCLSHQLDYFTTGLRRGDGRITKTGVEGNTGFPTCVYLRLDAAY